MDRCSDKGQENVNVELYSYRIQRCGWIGLAIG